MKIDKTKTRDPGEGLRRKRSEETQTGRISLLNEENRQEIRYLLVEKIIPYHKQARIHFDQEEIEKLAETIKAHGIRQPLTVIDAVEKEGFFEVVSGERRLRAAVLAGLKRVPCLVLHDPKHAEEVALIENIQRKDLHPIELGEGYKRLIDEGICQTQQEVADKLSVGRTHVVEMMQFADLPADIKQFLATDRVPRALLRTITTLVKEKNATLQDIVLMFQDELKRREAVALSQKEKRKPRKKLLVGIFADQHNMNITQNLLSVGSKKTLEKIKKELEKIIYVIDLKMKETDRSS